MPSNVNATNGRVCFTSNTETLVVDCVAYGNFTGDNSGFGTPATALPTTGNSSLVRSQHSIPDNNAADFALGTPAPRNNARLAGVVTPSVALVSIAVTPAVPSIAQGLATQFIATGMFDDSSVDDLTATATWASSNESVATIGSAGLATALAVGVTTISATSAAITGTVLTVTPAELVSVTVTPDAPSIELGEAQQFTATGTFTDESETNLSATATWASSDQGVATVTAAGLATGLAVGTTTISATSAEISGVAVLTVTSVSLVSIAVAPATPSVPLGLTLQFGATGTLANSSTTDLTATAAWASSDTAVASIDAAGLATAAGVGTTTVSATSEAVTGSTVLTVTPAELVSLAVTPQSPSVALGRTQPFVGTGTFTDASTQDLTAVAIWESSNVSVATVDAAGLATSAGEGDTTISATSDGIAGSTVLTVTQAEVVAIAVTSQSPSIAFGQSQQFMATAAFSDGISVNVTANTTTAWSSSNASVATIDGEGFASATGVGDTTIGASFDGVTGETTLTVEPLVFPQTPLPIPGFPLWAWVVSSSLVAALLAWRLRRDRYRGPASRM